MAPLESESTLPWSVQTKKSSNLRSPCPTVPRSVPAVGSALDGVVQSCQPRADLLKYSPFPLPRGGALAGSDARALNVLDKLREGAIMKTEKPPVSRQMAGRLGENYVPGVRLGVVANDDAHPERWSVRNRLSRSVTPTAIIILTILNNPPLIERKEPGSAVITKHRPSGLKPRPQPR